MNRKRLAFGKKTENETVAKTWTRHFEIISED